MSMQGDDRRMLVEWSTYVWFSIMKHGVIKEDVFVQ